MLRILSTVTDTRRRTKSNGSSSRLMKRAFVDGAIRPRQNAVWRDPSHSGRRLRYYSAKAASIPGRFTPLTSR